MMETYCVKVLLDTSILSGAELAESASIEETVLWGNVPNTVKVVGYRKRVFDDPSLQAEIDAIVTIGRLIREGSRSAFSRPCGLYLTCRSEASYSEGQVSRRAGVWSCNNTCSPNNSLNSDAQRTRAG